MPRYRYCVCREKSIDVNLWARSDAYRDNYPYYVCRQCRVDYGKTHGCGSILHPVDDEVFGPAARWSEVRAAGWEQPTALMEHLGLRSRKTLLRLRQDGLVQSWVYHVQRWNFQRAYRIEAAAPEALRDSIAFYEAVGKQIPVKLSYRSLLDDAGIVYEDGKRPVAKRGLASALLVEPWVAAIVEHGELQVGSEVFTPDDLRPTWQKRRLFKLAAIAWAQEDISRRQAIEAAAVIPQSGPRAVQQLLNAQIAIPRAAPYVFHREGARTQKAARRRRSR